MLFIPVVPLPRLILCWKSTRTAGIILVVGGVLPVGPVFSSLDPDSTLVSVLLLTMVILLVLSRLLFIQMKTG